MLRIELYTYRWTHEAAIEMRVEPISRFAISFQLAAMLRDNLTRCLEAAEQRAKLAQAAAASPTVQ
jgi:hypothetical protein